MDMNFKFNSKIKIFPAQWFANEIKNVEYKGSHRFQINSNPLSMEIKVM